MFTLKSALIIFSLIVLGLASAGQANAGPVWSGPFSPSLEQPHVVIANQAGTTV